MTSIIIYIAVLCILMPLVIYAEVKKSKRFREQKELVEELHRMINKHEKKLRRTK